MTLHALMRTCRSLRESSSHPPRHPRHRRQPKLCNCPFIYQLHSPLLFQAALKSHNPPHNSSSRKGCKRPRSRSRHHGRLKLRYGLGTPLPSPLFSAKCSKHSSESQHHRRSNCSQPKMRGCLRGRSSATLSFKGSPFLSGKSGICSRALPISTSCVHI